MSGILHKLFHLIFIKILWSRGSYAHFLCVESGVRYLANTSRMSLWWPVWSGLRSCLLLAWNLTLKFQVVYSSLINPSYNSYQAKSKTKSWHRFGNLLLTIKKKKPYWERFLNPSQPGSKFGVCCLISLYKPKGKGGKLVFLK